MIHLVYVSSATKEMKSEDLVELLKVSRERNEKKKHYWNVTLLKKKFLLSSRR